MSLTQSIRKSLLDPAGAVGARAARALDGGQPMETDATRLRTAIARAPAARSAAYGTAALGVAAAFGALAYYNIRRTRRDE